MAYYDALIAKWATLTPGTTAAKLAQINALTVDTGVAKPMVVSPSQIINAIIPADLASLTTAQVSFLTLVLAGSDVDASGGTTVRSAILTIFAGKTNTINSLAALAAPFDNGRMPWWQATVAQGGGGLNGPVTINELIGAGGLT